MYESGLVCRECGASYSTSEPLIQCDECGGMLEVMYDYGELSSRVNWNKISRRPPDIWRYGEFLPLCLKQKTMGEGKTPLVDSTWFGELLDLNLKFKLDFLNPTGSFKDRGTAVVAAKAKELGQKKVADDSSGNAGASLAAYASRLGLESVIYTPEGTPEDKLAQIKAYGADLNRIPGPRDNARQAIEEDYLKSDFYYTSHNKNPFFVEGNKTIAYEIYEELGGKVPDHLALPVGGGSLFLGAYKGFCELKRLGLIKDLPKMHCIQSSACDPIAEAFRRGEKEPVPVEAKESVAGGIHIASPPHGKWILQALKEVKGLALSVEEEKISSERLELSRKEGIYREPTSAVSILGLKKLINKNAVKPVQSVVLPLTGIGLKDRKTG